MEKQLVVFELGNEHYGVDIAAVEGIIKMQGITSVPHAPSFVEGVTNLRGAVLPVIDLRKRFGLKQELADTEAVHAAQRIMVAATGKLKVGMIVDAVSEVLRVNDEAIEPPPPMVTTVDSAFITGIAKIAQRLVILLDLGKVLSSGETAQLEKLPVVV